MYIAICGPPGAGKSTLQEILKEEFNVVPVDDGRVLRDIAIKCFGLSEEQVSTTSGKNSYIEFLGENWQIRRILGEIGRSLENCFSEYIVPYLTINNYCNNSGTNYSFGSVRRTQPLYFNQIGGIVVEIIRDGCKPVFDFDLYDRSKIDLVIKNNGSPEELRQLVIDKFSKIL